VLIDAPPGGWEYSAHGIGPAANGSLIMLEPRTKRRLFLFVIAAASVGLVAYSAWLLWPVYQEHRAVQRLLKTVRFGDQQAVDAAVAELQEFRWKGADAITELVKLMSSKTGGVRWRATYAIGELGEAVTALDAGVMRDRAVPALVAALSDEQARIRAAYALGQIGPDAQAAVPELIKALGHEDQYFNGQAGHALARIGEPAIDPLLEAVSTGSGVGSLRAIDVLGEIGTGASERSIPALLVAFELGNPDVQKRAAAALSKCRRPAVPDLIRLLRANEGRSLIAQALADIGPDALDAIPTLLDKIVEAGERGDLVAATAVGNIGGTPALIKALDVEAVRPSVIQAISNRGPPASEVMPALLRILKTDKRSQVRNAATWYFMRLGPEASEAVQALIEMLREPVADRQSDVRHSVLQALMRIGPAAEAAVPEILKLITPDEPPHIEIMAAVALSAIDPDCPDLLPAMIAALKRDLSIHERVQAIRTLAQLGPRSAPAVPLLIAELEKGPTAPTRHAAVSALGKIGPAAAEAVPAIIQVLAEEDDPQSWTRIVAIEALGSIGPAAKAALPCLTELKKMPNATVQQAVKRAMQMIEADPGLEQ
jgi:HEAT repeat protein